MLCHDVYFTLNDTSAEAVDHLLGEFKKYLIDHPGVVFFASGRRDTELQRPVNDQNFDVSLHIVFADRPAHDRAFAHRSALGDGRLRL